RGYDSGGSGALAGGSLAAFWTRESGSVIMGRLPDKWNYVTWRSESSDADEHGDETELVSVRMRSLRPNFRYYDSVEPFSFGHHGLDFETGLSEPVRDFGRLDVDRTQLFQPSKRSEHPKPQNCPRKRTSFS
ncbi:MAG: hypothetical protein JJ992_07520, partial [Planctomycetes bacterium]|nr:hypothetical protein [Planctomycetota bacterium]